MQQSCSLFCLYPHYQLVMIPTAQPSTVKSYLVVNIYLEYFTTILFNNTKKQELLESYAQTESRESLDLVSAPLRTLFSFLLEI